MIHRLRRRHLRAVLLLAVAAPLLLGLGLLGRRPTLRVETLPHLLLETSFGAAQSVASRDDLFSHSEITLHLLRIEDRSGIEIRATRSLTAPDVLVYWSARDDDPKALPGGAHLVGRLRGREPCRAALPRGARGGWIILYSLGHKQRLDSAALDPLFAADAP